MLSLSIFAQAAETSPDWVRSVFQPHNLPSVVLVTAIIGTTIYTVTKAMMNHRERLAKIARGIDPDAKAT